MNMKRISILLTLLALLSGGMQNSLRAVDIGTNHVCESPDFFCSDTSFEYSHHGSKDICNPNPLILYYYFEVYSTITSVVVSCPGQMSAYALYGPFDEAYSVHCNGVSDPDTIIASSSSTQTSYTMNDGSQLGPGFYYLKITMVDCSNTVSFTINEGEGSLRCEQLPCENCIGSFAPEPGRKYIISMWVKEEGAALTKTSYDYPEVYLEFGGTATVLGAFTASGQIIDGWQRIEQEFTVPSGATSIKIRLECSSDDCYFDDIRIHPFDGSMKTYVFDPVNLRLVAELDERNYATIYEYDEEGKLIRVKKETERGVMTIQESKSSINKQ